jgi:hypothetical protein
MRSASRAPKSAIGSWPRPSSGSASRARRACIAAALDVALRDVAHDLAVLPVRPLPAARAWRRRRRHGERSAARTGRCGARAGRQRLCRRSLAQYERLYHPTWGPTGGRRTRRPATTNTTRATRAVTERTSALAQRRLATRGTRSTKSAGISIARLQLLPRRRVRRRAAAVRMARARSQHETKPCVLAYWHHPWFSSGKHGSTTSTRPFWSLLYQHGGDVVLDGHDRSYERFTPLAPDGRAEPGGIHEFVGTGLGRPVSVGLPEPGSEVRQNHTHGVLRLTLARAGTTGASSRLPEAASPTRARGDCR